MQLLIRTIDCDGVSVERVLAALRKLAITMVRERRANSIMACRGSDGCERVVWIQHAATETKDGQRISFDGLPAEAIAVEFADGFYRHPLAPSDLWLVEAHDRPAGHQILTLAHLANADPKVAGVAVYHALNEEHGALGFLALEPAVSARDYVLDLLSPQPGCPRPTTVEVCRLTISWTIGRLASGAGMLPAGRFPQAAFWTRLAALRPAAEPAASGSSLALHLGSGG